MTPERLAEIKGAFVVLCAVGVVISVGAYIVSKLYRPRRPSQAETLGQMMLDEFRGDYGMAWAEVCRIKAERRMLVRVANAVARGAPAGAAAAEMQTGRVH